tara:strand:- start:5457 stop:5723 length:267 start_codon:yes stop_codon:yes gene_type:complete
MLNAQLLHKLKEKHPNYTEAQIKIIIMWHIGRINSMFSKAETFKLTINKLGTIHTHGNAVSERKISLRKYHKKNMNKVNNFTDAALLF